MDEEAAAKTEDQAKLTPESKDETSERAQYEQQRKFYEDTLKRSDLTELQRQQMRSELAKLKVAWQESEQTRTNKLKEGEGYTPVKARTTGFQVEKARPTKLT